MKVQSKKKDKLGIESYINEIIFKMQDKLKYN